ncbi:MAG TPA: M48 family metalloprotease [Terriglobales bacterium]|nr:M48 family metalloprotease [Terriglobales bacterium]
MLLVLVVVLVAAAIALETTQVAAQFGIPRIPGIPGFSRSEPQESPMDMFRAFEDMDEPQEVEVGRSVAAAVGARYPILRDVALTKYVAMVGNTVAAVSDRPDLRYYFAVLDTPQPEALAAPGGFVFISKGTLDVMRDEAMLAGVLGHEIGHIALKHHNETIKDQRKKGLAMIGVNIGLSFVPGPAGYFTPVMSLVADGLAEGVLKGFSRSEEMASDKVGFEYAARAGYDPAGLREFLAALSSRNDAGATKFFATHPGTEDRLQEQAKLRKEWTGGGRREAARFTAAMGR